MSEPGRRPAARAASLDLELHACLFAQGLGCLPGRSETAVVMCGEGGRGEWLGTVRITHSKRWCMIKVYAWQQLDGGA